jgi:hypothetical protein
MIFSHFMKTLEQILLDDPPFYPNSSTDELKMRFMFLLEDGRAIGNPEGQNHSVLIGLTAEDGDDTSQIEREFCRQNNAVRVCFQRFTEKSDGTRGEFWALYIEIFNVRPNDAQWDALSNLYLVNGHRNTFVTWDVYSPKKKKWENKSERSLAELRQFLNPPPRPVRPTSRKKRRTSKRIS